ncbi:MAG: PAS domain-containing protein [Armatimonadetes bacterium]|nr:PAS domain-containing protein [Armatimonadota bacterium]
MPPQAGWEPPPTVLDATQRLGDLVGVLILRADDDKLVSVQEPETLRMPAAEAFVGGCLSTGRALVANAGEERLHPRERALLAERGADFMLAVPVLVDPAGRPEGVVVGFQKLIAGSAGGDQARLALSLLAEHVAMSRRWHLAMAQAQEASDRALQSSGEAEGILHGVRAPALVLTADNRLHDANRAAEVLLGFHLPRGRGKLVSEVIAEPTIVAVLCDTQTTGGGKAPEVRLSRPEEVILEVRISPVFDARGELRWRVVVLNDTTTVRQADELKSDFVSLISHELRTPLTSIKAFAATLLRDEGARPEDQREWLKIIDHECDRLTALVNDLLVISRLDSGRPLVLNWQSVELMPLLEAVAEAHQASAHRHHIEVVGPERIALSADADRLRQILANLVSNAIKYSPRGGQVEISAEETTDDVRILVRDQGVGIRPEHLNLVFEKFFQVDGSTTRRVGGSGLGLYLTRRLVEAHGGSVWAESELGKGSTLVVVLPKHATPGVQ